jgi:hypothetical protein
VDAALESAKNEKMRQYEVEMKPELMESKSQELEPQCVLPSFMQQVLDTVERVLEESKAHKGVN